MRCPTILIAADDFERGELRLRLSALGYRVIEGTDRAQVVAQCASGLADAVVIGHEMPNFDGRSFARMIRNEADVPIVLSGHDREEFRQIVMQLPDVYFLSRPLDEDRLADLLGALAPAQGSRQPVHA